MTRTERQVASWARKAREATSRRDEAILAMLDAGASLRAVAAAAGMSHTQIANILKRSSL